MLYWIWKFKNYWNTNTASTIDDRGRQVLRRMKITSGILCKITKIIMEKQNFLNFSYPSYGNIYSDCWYISGHLEKIMQFLEKIFIYKSSFVTNFQFFICPLHFSGICLIFIKFIMDIFNCKIPVAIKWVWSKNSNRKIFLIITFL